MSYHISCYIGLLKKMISVFWSSLKIFHNYINSSTNMPPIINYQIKIRKRVTFEMGRSINTNHYASSRFAFKSPPLDAHLDPNHLRRCILKLAVPSPESIPSWAPPRLTVFFFLLSSSTATSASFPPVPV